MEFLTVKGKKYYPVGHFLKYQHIFYNYNDRCANAYYDDMDNDHAYEQFERAQELLEKFNTNPQDKNGIVYAEYEDYKEMKDIIGGYAERHNGYV